MLAEIRALVADGVVEVTLLGQNVNSYGAEFGDRLAFGKLLRACGEIDGLERVRFTSPHPRDFTDDVIDAMAQTRNVMPQLHMPLQSGSDAVLRAMRRAYRRDKYLAILDRVRAAIPDAAITTDIIVGFPGETESDFADTLDLVRQARFAGAFTFQYSIRRGYPRRDDGRPGAGPRWCSSGTSGWSRWSRRRRWPRTGSSPAGRSRCWWPTARAARTRRRTGCPAGPGTTGWCISRLRAAVAGARQPGDMVTTVVTRAAPHYLIADGEPAAVRRTPGGDAWAGPPRKPRAGRRIRRPPARRGAARHAVPAPSRLNVLPGHVLGCPRPAGRAGHGMALRCHTDAMPPLIAVVGPTAAGKSGLSLRLARALGGEVVNADSMQLYRGMDIGTAKLPPGERCGVPHHLLDIWDVTRAASVSEYQRLARAGPSRTSTRAAGSRSWSAAAGSTYARFSTTWTSPAPTRGCGTGWRASWPRSARRPCTRGWPGWTRPRPRRSCRETGAGSSGPSRWLSCPGGRSARRCPTTSPSTTSVQIGVRVPRPQLDERIASRVAAMWQAGFVAEVRGLAEAGLRDGRTASRALGYAQVLRFLAGEWSQEKSLCRDRAGDAAVRPPAGVMVPARSEGHLAGPGRPGRGWRGPG